MSPACKARENLAGCTCTYAGCSRRGVCCDCVAFHRRNGEIPGCFFPPGEEKKYDRTLEAFFKAHGR